MTKYIFVTGGVVSSLGKGIIAASLGKLLRARDYSVIIQKFDPYINVDPGTMSPFQHGEVFVTDDGAETDLDLGHYERFTDTSFGQVNNVTSGRIYQEVINKELLKIAGEQLSKDGKKKTFFLVPVFYLIGVPSDSVPTPTSSFPLPLYQSPTTHPPQLHITQSFSRNPTSSSINCLTFSFFS